MKVPVVLQRSTVECGAACLTMILRAHAIPATLADCRRQLDPGPNGVNALSLTEVALKLGLRAWAYSAKTPAALQELSLPAIVHFENNHFVVLEGWSRRRDRVLIVDPAVGRRRLGWPEFLARHSGLALVFERSLLKPDLTPRHSRPWRGLVRRLLGQPDVRRLAAGLLASTLFLHLLGLALPLTAAVLVDGAWTSDPVRQVDVLGVGVASLALGLIALSHLRSLLLVFFGSRALGLMALGALPSPLSEPLEEGGVTRDLLRRVRRAAADQAVDMIVDGLWVLIPPLALLAIAPWSAGIVVAAAGLQAAILLGRPVRVARGEEQESASRALDLLDGLTPGQEDLVRAPSWHGPALAVVRVAAPLLLVWIGSHKVLLQRTTPGTLLAITCLAVQFLGPFASLLATGRRLRSIDPD